MAKVIGVIEIVAGAIITIFAPYIGIPLIVAGAATLYTAYNMPDAPELDGRKQAPEDSIKAIPDAYGQLIYGTGKVGGILVYQNVASSYGSDQYDILDYVVVHAFTDKDHGIEAFGDIYIDNNRIKRSDINEQGEVTGGDYAGLVQVWQYDGTQTSADNILVSAYANDPDVPWEYSAVGVGCVYTHFRFKAGDDQDAFNKAFGGHPPYNVAAVIQGEKAYNPVTGSHAYSENPGVCLYDYMTREDNGASLPASFFESSDLSATISVCDEDITYPGTQRSGPRFTLNGAVKLSNKRSDIVTKMLGAMAGEVVQGEGRISIRSGSYTPPSGTIDESFLRGSVQVQEPTQDDRYNYIKASFRDKDNDWQQMPAPSFPKIGSALFDQWKEEDGGYRMDKSLTLAFVGNADNAQVIEQIVGRKSRFLTQLSMECNHRAMAFRCGDRVYVDIPEVAHKAVIYKIKNLQLRPDFGVDLTLEQDHHSIYGWDNTIAREGPIVPVHTPKFYVPPPVQGFGVSPQPDGIHIGWDTPQAHKVDATEVWRSDTVGGTYTRIYRGANNSTIDPNDGSTRYYKARNHAAGEYSAFTSIISSSGKVVSDARFKLTTDHDWSISVNRAANWSYSAIERDGGAAAPGTWTFSIIDGSLPDGLPALSASGVVSGTPTNFGQTAWFTVQAKDAHGNTLTLDDSVYVGAVPLTITGGVGTQTIEKDGGYSGWNYVAEGRSGAVTWALAAGALPPGFTWSASTAQVTRTGTAALGEYEWTITTTDSTGAVATLQEHVEVVPDSVRVSNVTYPVFGFPSQLNIGQTVDAVFEAKNFSHNPTWSVGGDLPPGLSGHVDSGDAMRYHVSGTTTHAGNYDFGVSAEYQNATASIGTFSVTVGQPRPVYPPDPGRPGIHPPKLTRIRSTADLPESWLRRHVHPSSIDPKRRIKNLYRVGSGVQVDAEEVSRHDEVKSHIGGLNTPTIDLDSKIGGEYVIKDGSVRFGAIHQPILQESTSGAQTKADAAEDGAKSYTDSQLTNYVDAITYSTKVDDLQAQIDGEIDQWSYGYDPTLTNVPASNWTTTTLKKQHLNDVFTNNGSGTGTVGASWRWASSAGVYGWVRISDTAVEQALATASQAQDTADHKRRVFVAQPTVPYDKGDLWRDGNKVKCSNTSKVSPATYSATDWDLIGDVTSQNTAADTANVAGRDSGAIAAAAKQSLIYDMDAVPAGNLYGTGTYAIVSDAGQVGGGVLRATNYVYWVNAPATPYDPAKLYRIRAGLRVQTDATTTQQGQYVGIRTYDKAGASIGNNNGNMYVAARFVHPTVSDGYVVYEGWISGTAAANGPASAHDPTNPSPCITGTASIKPFVLLNSQASDSGQETDLDFFSVDIYDVDSTQRPLLGLDNMGAVRLDVPGDHIKYDDGTHMEALKPREARAEKTAGKSLTILVDRDTSNLDDDAGLGNTANWSQVSDDNSKRPADNADVTLNHLAKGTAIPDTRDDNQPPSWYRSDVGVRSEFKSRDAIGAPGSAIFGTLVTKTPWPSPSSGNVLVTQEFHSPDGVFVRQGKADDSGWKPWYKSFDEGRKPTWTNDLLARPTELTDGRVSTALSATGRLKTALTAAVANSSNLLRYTGGAVFTGAIDATKNKTDSYLLDRSNQTGTQILATISDAGALAGKDKVAYSLDIKGAPKALGDINSTEGAKLSGIAPYADKTSIHTAADTSKVDGQSASITRSYAQDGHDLTQNSSGTRLGGQLNIPPIVGANYATGYWNNSNLSSSGTTITAASGSYRLGSSTISYNSSAVTVSQYDAYAVYFNDLDFSGGSRTLHATTGKAYLESDGNIYVGSISTTSGTGGPIINPPECVTANMLLRPDIPAALAKRNVKVDCADDYATIGERLIDSARTAVGQCIRITASDGAILECSLSTPFTMPDKSIKLASELEAGDHVLTDTGDCTITDIEDIGERTVVHISVGGLSFAAGQNASKRIYSHNTVKQ